MTRRALAALLLSGAVLSAAPAANAQCEIFGCLLRIPCIDIDGGRICF